MKSSQILSLVDIFSDLTPAQLELISGICTEKSCGKGQVIFEENSPSNEIYIVLEGQVDILISAGSLSKEGPVKNEITEAAKIASVERGQSFGEIALVDLGLRSASAICVADHCTLLVINRDAFMKLMKENPQLGFTVMYNLATDLCTKIRQTNYKAREAIMYTHRDIFRM